MFKEGRTQKSIRNISTSLIVQIVNKITNFVIRTVFIRYLSLEYLGINGLFTNILMMLSFAELGIGTAILYKMYEPIAKNDTEKVKGLMDLYKKSYIIIGTVFFLCGIGVIPFLKYIIKDIPDIKENISIIYLLFLVNTCISYFYTYKRSIIIASQKQNIINGIDTIFYFLKCIVEVIVLISTRNYILFLCIEFIATLFENIAISYKADKMYPYIKEKNIEKISKKERKNIFSNVRALVVYKIGNVVMNGTDNIIISSIISLSAVGICSNYVLIINAIKGIMQTSLNSITASIGDLNVNAVSKTKEDIYYQYLFVYYIVASFCTIAFIILLNPFIVLWLGKQYLVDFSVTIALSVNFFIDSLMQPGYIYRTTLGMFKKTKATPYIGATVNIVLSIILGKILGLLGVFIATGISLLISYVWIDPYLLHKYVFYTNFRKYLVKYLLYFCAFSFELIICILISNIIKFGGISAFLLKVIIVSIIPNIFNIILFKKCEEYKMLMTRLKGMRLKN